MGRAGQSEENMILAYELHLRHGKVPRVLEELRSRGVEIGRSQLYEWIKQGQAMAVHVEILREDEERQRTNQRYNNYAGLVGDWVENGMVDYLDALDRLLKIEEGRRQMLGLDAPRRMEATMHSGTQGAINPSTLVTLRAAEDRARMDRRALRSEVIEQITSQQAGKSGEQ